MWKGQKNNRPRTLVRLGRDGRKRFLEYIGVLEGLVADAAGAARRAPNSVPEGFSPV